MFRRSNPAHACNGTNQNGEAVIAIKRHRKVLFTHAIKPVAREAWNNPSADQHHQQDICTDTGAIGSGNIAIRDRQIVETKIGQHDTGNTSQDLKVFPLMTGNDFS
ncbi:hypothetical protein D9M70_561180 [compost metagenome]